VEFLVARVARGHGRDRTLGVEVSTDNIVRSITEGSQAALTLKVGDRIVSLDTMPLYGRYLSDVVDPERDFFNLGIVRRKASAEQYMVPYPSQSGWIAKQEARALAQEI
jgi:hypothetical protein